MMPTIVRSLKQEVPICIELNGKDKLRMLSILQQALLPRNLGDDDYNQWVSGLEAAFRFELNKKD